MAAPSKDFPRLHDIGHFYDRLEKAVARVRALRPYKVEPLGRVGRHDILLLAPEKRKRGKADILAAGGFHGEEPAGPWGIVSFLETADEKTLNSVNYSFLPLVNPTGFAKGRRFNLRGENPNRGFVREHHDAGEEERGGWTNHGPSLEGKILVRHLDRLLKLGRDGFISQHEDSDIREGFLFINEKTRQPGLTAKRLLDVLGTYFRIMPDGGRGELRGSPIKNGLWVNGMDSSFETLLYLNGIPRTITSETPGLMPPHPRIDCNRDLTRAFGEASAKIVARQKAIAARAPARRSPAPR